MILTVTLNPAVDRTMVVPRLCVGEDNRATKVMVDASGKGLNVSRALQCMHVPSLALAPLGGDSGRFIESEARRWGLDLSPIRVPEETRVNIKVIESEEGNRLTQVNARGARLPAAVVATVKERLLSIWTESSTWGADLPTGQAAATREDQGAKGRPACANLCVFSGSLPPGVEPGFYAEMIDKLSTQGVLCVLDTSRQALEAALSARPFVLKPNQEEAESLLGRIMNLEDEPDVVAAAQELTQFVSGYLVLSLGAAGAVYATDRHMVWARVSPRRVENPTGCGDMLVACWLYSYLQGHDLETMARFGVSGATATAMLPGTDFPDLEAIEGLMPEVIVQHRAV